MNLLHQASSTLLWGWAALAALFAYLWWRQLRSRNATSVDAAWSLTIGLLAVTAALTATGSASQRLIAAAVAGLWSARLTAYLVFDRVLMESAEDGRYRALRNLLGKREAVGFFFVYQLQALLALGFATPFVLMCYGEAEAISAVQLTGIAVAVSSQILESIADRQLARHRADRTLAGKACRAGLWRYSRHPNYFFEWLTWCGFALVHAEALGWSAAIAPVAMGLSTRFFTGVPFTEKRALVSRGDDYRRYMAETNVFFPWFPNSSTKLAGDES